MNSSLDPSPSALDPSPSALSPRPTPLLTVVMSCYNQADTVAQAIESVLMQKTDFPVRLIVTDDHSTKDDSVAVIREYAAKYPDRIVALFNDENGRYLKNVLRAMAQVKSEYFTLLDADDYWTDANYLSDAVAFLERHQEHAVYGRNIEWIKEGGERGVQCRPELPDADFDFDGFFASRHVTPLTPSAVFRNVIFREGVPAFLAEAVGTDLERPFDGDVFRFLQHLNRGRYHFENRVSGVYRMTGSGIYIGLSPASRDLIQAFCYVAYARHFNRNLTWFLAEARRCLERALVELVPQVEMGRPVDPSALRMLGPVTDYLARHHDELPSRRPTPVRTVTDRLTVKAHVWLEKRMVRKGFK